MTDRTEPSHNIAGGTPVEREPGDPETRAEAVVDRLGDLFWQTTYGDQDAFESLVRTILSQNTSDQASQPAHDALLERYGEAGDFARALADADREAIATVIEPAGLYNQKSRVIKRTAEHVLGEYGSAEAFDRYVRAEDAVAVRDTLLQLTEEAVRRKLFQALGVDSTSESTNGS